MPAPRFDIHAHVVPDGYVDTHRLPDGSRFTLRPAPRDTLEAVMPRHAIDAALASTGPSAACLTPADCAASLDNAAPLVPRLVEAHAGEGR